MQPRNRHDVQRKIQWDFGQFHFNNATFHHPAVKHLLQPQLLRLSHVAADAAEVLQCARRAGLPWVAQGPVRPRRVRDWYMHMRCICYMCQSIDGCQFRSQCSNSRRWRIAGGEDFFNSIFEVIMIHKIPLSVGVSYNQAFLKLMTTSILGNEYIVDSTYS